MYYTLYSVFCTIHSLHCSIQCNSVQVHLILQYFQYSCSVVHFSTVQCNTVHCSVVKGIAADYGGVEFCAVQSRSAVYISVAVQCKGLTCFITPGPRQPDTKMAIYCTALHCIVLYSTSLHCTVQSFTAMHCNLLHCTVVNYNTVHSGGEAFTALAARGGKPGAFSPYSWQFHSNISSWHSPFYTSWQSSL